MKRSILAAASLATVVFTASASRADVQLPCIGAWAAARPGPVAPLQAAVRLVANPIAQSEADFSVRLFDGFGQEILVEREPVGDGSYFLLAAQDLAVGSYLLEYTDACESAPQEIDLAVVPAPALPPTLGVLEMAYEAYCPGEFFDSMWGPISKDYPPPVYVSFDLAPELEPFGPFIHIQFHDDLGEAYWTGGFPFLNYGYHLGLSRSAACGVSDSVPLGHRVLTADADIVDGPALPSISAEADITCLDCPIERGPKAVDHNQHSETWEPGRYSCFRCSVESGDAGGRFTAFFVLMALGAARRRARR